MENIFFKDQVIVEMTLKSALRDRKIILNEEVDRDSIFKACYLIDRIVEIDKKEGTKKPIEIVIDSYGGVIYNGLHFISKICSLKKDGYKIITTVNSVAMSMGFTIAVVGSERRAFSHSRFMTHQPLSGSWGWSKMMDAIEDSEETVKLWERLKSIIIENTHITNEELEDIKIRKQDWFMWPEEALLKGVIDYII